MRKIITTSSCRIILLVSRTVCPFPKALPPISATHTPPSHPLPIAITNFLSGLCHIPLPCSLPFSLWCYLAPSDLHHSGSQSPQQGHSQCSVLHTLDSSLPNPPPNSHGLCSCLVITRQGPPSAAGQGVSSKKVCSKPNPWHLRSGLLRTLALESSGTSEKVI